MLIAAAVLMFSWSEPEWSERGQITLDLAAHEDASWSALVAELVAIGAS